MAPSFSHIIDVPFVCLPSRLRNDLNVPSPCGEVSLFDMIVQIFAGEIRLGRGFVEGFVSCEVSDSLLCLECILNKEDLPL